MAKNYDIVADPEANILYQKCRDVDDVLWEALTGADPDEVMHRTRARYQEEAYILPFLNRELTVQPAERLLQVSGQDNWEPEFQLCLTALLFLLKVDAAQLPSRQVSPKEYKGGVIFFQGPHALPTSRLEERLGSQRELFLSAGRSLGGEEVSQGDAAIALTAFPNLKVEVILWLGDEEFPPRSSSRLRRRWNASGPWTLSGLY